MLEKPFPFAVSSVSVFYASDRPAFQAKFHLERECMYNL